MMSPNGRSIRAEAGVVLLFLLLSAAMTHPLILHLDRHVPSDRVDPLFTMWLLNWEHASALRGFQGFFDAPIFHPHGGTLLYADYLPALGLITAPLRLLLPDWIWVYNVLFLLSFAFSGWGMHRLVLYLAKSRPASFTAGLIFAFFTYRLAHISHLELLMTGWMPLFFLSLIKFIDRPSVRHVLGVGLFFLLQTWSCVYYGVFLAYFAAAALVYLAIKTQTYRRAVFWKRLLLLAAVGLPPLVLYFLPYLAVHQKMFLGRTLDEVLRHSAQLESFWSVPRWNSFWGWALRSQPSPEWIRYPGIAALALAAAGAGSYLRTYLRELREEGKGPRAVWDALMLVSGAAWLQTLDRTEGVWPLLRTAFPFLLAVSLGLRIRSAWRRRPKKARIPAVPSLARRLFFAMFWAAWLFSFGPWIFFKDKALAVGPYRLLLGWAPGLDGLRAPSRLAVLMMLAASVLAGLAVARWTAGLKSAAGRTVLAAFLGALILADYAAVPLPLAEVPAGEGIPPIYDVLRGRTEPGALIELPLPMTRRESVRHALLMYYSIRHGKPLVQGYSGYFPPGYVALSEIMENFPSDKTIRLLRNFGVGYVIVHEQNYRPDAAARIREGLDRRPETFIRIDSLDNDTLYVLLPDPPPTAAPSGEAVPSGEGWRAMARSNLARARAALDGNPATYWSTTSTQKRGEYFRLDFPDPVTVSGIELHQGPRPLDFPRAFVVEGSDDGLGWAEFAAETEGMPVLVPETIEDIRNYRLVVSFPRRTTRHLRLRLTENFGRHHWSIAEIRFRR